MKLPEHIRYVGRMKQPLQKMNVFAPSMFALSDPEKVELCVIILTPGAFCHAYEFIKGFGAKIVKIFVPSLRPEFISDVMNLYMSLKNKMPVKWVFPEKYNHYSFSMGHEKCGVYIHPVDPMISIEYIKNSEVDRLYDILVKCEEGQHYFSLHMTDEKCMELFYCRTCTFIHVPKSAPIYGGMSYDALFDMNKKFRRKLVPFDFTSYEEYIKFRGGHLHEIPKPPQEDQPDKEDENKHHHHHYHKPHVVIDEWYPGHPPITIEGEPGRPVEPDEETNAKGDDHDIPVEEDPIETPEGDESDAENSIVQGSE